MSNTTKSVMLQTVNLVLILKEIDKEKLFYDFKMDLILLYIHNLIHFAGWFEQKKWIPM